MKKYFMGMGAIAFAIAFITLSSFRENPGKSNSEITVRFVQNASWSTSDELLSDAELSSGCPEGVEEICAEFYDINHLNFSGSNVSGIKNMPGTTDPYPPDAVLRYN
jgi:hypothetical protein